MPILVCLKSHRYCRAAMAEGDGGARGRAFAMASMFFTERKRSGAARLRNTAG